MGQDPKVHRPKFIDSKVHAPLGLSSSPWGYTPSCVPLPVLLAMVGQLLAMLMIST